MLDVDSVRVNIFQTDVGVGDIGDEASRVEVRFDASTVGGVYQGAVCELEGVSQSRT